VPAVGQPKIASSDEAVIGLGVTKSYPLPAATLIAALHCHLCTAKLKVLIEQSDAQGHEMTCRSAEPERNFLSSVMFFVPERSESATPWARVTSENSGAGSSTRVTIGATLHRDDKRLKSARGHFFRPSAWAQGVWEALDQWPPRAGATRCP
jgi:hypothetical protein